MALALSLSASQLPATLYEIGPGDDLQAAVNALGPGDILQLRGGLYTLTSRLAVDVSGTPTAPILIRAKNGETPVLTFVDASQNVINVEDNQHLILQGLEVTGGSQGIRIDHASFITVEDCHIHDTADAALSANFVGSSYQGLRLLRNHIHHTDGTGEGMYLGCNDNGCQMFESLIEGNYIHHTNAPTVSQGDGIELKEGSHDNIIRDNVIHDTGYPCIITYGTVGNGGPNVVEGNVLWSCGDHAIQSAADAVIRNNIILGAAGDGIRSQPHQAGRPSNLVIVHNTVLEANDNSLRISDAALELGPILVANNALYAADGYALRVGVASGPASELTVSGNAGVGAVLGVGGGFDPGGDLATDFLAASYAGQPPNDVYPAPGGILPGAGDPSYVEAEDFNHTARAGVADVGAYAYDPGGNPGWTLTPGFKPPAAVFADGFESGDAQAWSSSVP